ncbi:uncharacterized protein C8R40DRAFT_1072780 [Lentinula edodes]|uniref:uncharacterized protein n=1 Tax=Lentinula edodes TaxID=5353 RepID=UPI001E8E00C4|nr:uncharacterized protein C8R40DRAFT_1072780 [Lentinula edodes]KAH7870986.1 hypothetical protein C8R40DRAFT_1072780 [Lentinula edodes]
MEHMRGNCTFTAMLLWCFFAVQFNAKIMKIPPYAIRTATSVVLPTYLYTEQHSMAYMTFARLCVKFSSMIGNGYLAVEVGPKHTRNTIGTALHHPSDPRAPDNERAIDGGGSKNDSLLPSPPPPVQREYLAKCTWQPM